MPRNIELKARLADTQLTLERAAALGAGPPQVERQRDTYFRAGRRFKLRERWQVSAAGDTAPIAPELIAYRRPDEAGARASDYVRLALAPDTGIRDVLALAVGVEVVVEKVRRVFLHDGVRIHVDEVDGLGAFLEFEAIVGDDCDDEAAAAKVERLREHFDLDPSQIVAGSYRELARSL